MSKEERADFFAPDLLREAREHAHLVCSEVRPLALVGSTVNLEP